MPDSTGRAQRGMAECEHPGGDGIGIGAARNGIGHLAAQTHHADADRFSGLYLRFLRHLRADSVWAGDK
jgi:hypothetical protein